jgi:hypothetical protein
VHRGGGAEYEVTGLQYHLVGNRLALADPIYRQVLAVITHWQPVSARIAAGVQHTRRHDQAKTRVRLTFPPAFASHQALNTCKIIGCATSW